MRSHLQDFLRYLKASTSTYHAAKETAQRLAENDFEPLAEKEAWKLSKKKSYFLVRDQAAVVAFKLPAKTPKRAVIIASHLDSPGLKVRPGFASPSENTQLGVEIYGGPLLNSWFNVDLGIAGRIVSLDAKGKLSSKLVDFSEFPLIIPQLPIHLDREANEKGLQINKQEHLRPIFSFSKVDFEHALKKHTPFKELISYDLFLYPLMEPSLIGFEQEMIASYRLDNLSSAHASLMALMEAKGEDDVLPIAIFWDHEEIGSKTYVGADSSFLLDIFERISCSYGMSREEFLQCKASSFCLSIDVTHGMHPNYSCKFDTQFTPILGKGPCLKYSAAQKYMNNALSSSAIQRICDKKKIPLQKYAARNDTPSGSTVGPMMSSSLSMRTVDIGLPLLAMHTTREVTSVQDQLELTRLLKASLESFEEIP